MMRKSIRIFRLIRRRRFRYRRLHAWRLDLVAVMLLFGAGWLLLPPINQTDRSSPAEPASPTASGLSALSIIEKPLINHNEAVLSPVMFAFTAPEGFAHGVVAAQLSKIGGQIPFIPSTPIHRYSLSVPESVQNVSMARVGKIAPLKMPPPPVSPVNAESNSVFASEVYIHMSIPGIVPTGHFHSTIENSAGKTVRIAVYFGADGRADSAVLFSHALDAADAARVERAAMQLTGPPNASAWIVLRASF